jgi:nondiscriminating glutamyl-tRNA synthetase
MNYMENTKKVRVRMAPSPTGFFHIGSARTAFFNWLFARHHKGDFILRVEDTDAARSSQDMIDVVLKGMAWLGMDKYEGPYFQSQRLSLYKEHVDRLIKAKKAYYCYCRPEDLDRERKAAYARKQDWKYDRRCLFLSEQEKKKKEEARIPKAVRFLVPDQTVMYKDIVFGEISRDAKDIEDFVLQRASGMPTYNLACVVDDHEMSISHIIRGADHITNTPKQILLYNAFDYKPPQFAHLPLILGPDKSKLSKRHGAISVIDYKNTGFIPAAVVNYIALLGWSPGDDREIMTLDELIERFSLERINPSNAVFDITKLEWMNQQYIIQMTPTEFQNTLKPYVITAGLMDEKSIEQNNDWFQAVCVLVQPRLKTLSEIDQQARYFFKEDFVYDQKAIEKFSDSTTCMIMDKFLTELQHIEPFDVPALETNLRNLGEVNGLKVKQWIHPLRVFTTGTKAGPPFFDTLVLIGKKRCIDRVARILKKIRENK